MGTLQSTYTSDPFGETTQGGSFTTNCFAFACTGRELEAGNLYYYCARYYNPQLQRFISEDPIAFRGKQTNFYSYVANSPVNLKDSFGLWGAGVTFGATGFAGLPGALGSYLGLGGTVSLGGAYFADKSSPLGFTSGGYLTEGAFAGSSHGQWGNPDGGNGVGGLDAGAGAGFIITNGNSIGDLAGPFENSTLALPFVTFDFAQSNGGVWTFNVTAGPGWGLGFAHYCTNTWTNPVSDASFPSPGNLAGRNCGCSAGH